MKISSFLNQSRTGDPGGAGEGGVPLVLRRTRRVGAISFPHYHPPIPHWPRAGSEALVQERCCPLGLGRSGASLQTPCSRDMRRQHSRKCDRARPNRRILSSSTSSCRAAQLPGPAPPLSLPPPPCRGCTQAGGAALTLVVPNPREVRGLPLGCSRPARPEPRSFRGRCEAQPSCLPRSCLGLAGKRAAGKSRRAQEAGHGHRALREWCRGSRLGSRLGALCALGRWLRRRRDGCSCASAAFCFFSPDSCCLFAAPST